MRTLLYIGTGSFIGGISRYLLSRLIQSNVYSSFPFGTFAVNIAGCFLIGMVFQMSERGSISQDMRLFLATGILGGFTTFSAFSNETFGMIRDSQFLHASLYAAGSIIIGLLATFAGAVIVRNL